MIGDMTGEEVRERDRMRLAELKDSGYPVEVVWECDVDTELRNNPEMADFFANHKVSGILRMERALVGGRTEVFRLIVDDKRKIMNFNDVISLYPSVMKYCRFPVGPPRDVPATDIKVPMTAPKDLTFSGFMLCRVLAPDHLRLPLIDDKSCGKLVFGLCKICMREENQEDCQHTDDERSFTGVYTTVELHKALGLGYKILEVFHAIEHKYWVGNDLQGKGGLFTSYR
ncbi:hypothetical protein GCK72_004531 [Caenorhabditis remanei]|uniref:DNA-directed DNA polymerase n=1 Tax=Caenorhabditis remanei TaxID=31234 RepID=A0A6A5HE49_CAERE|nr:hypothetical protein GCK72_004531 [Caenorhabditis remanei]KAF1764582.1 hypothetical protein GCK72_004531 [Caenorhabditis remanei]